MSTPMTPSNSPLTDMDVIKWCATCDVFTEFVELDVDVDGPNIRYDPADVTTVSVLCCRECHEPEEA